MNEEASLSSSLSKLERSTFLDDDYCVIANRDFFVRGIIRLPIIGTAETFRWGVWGTLSSDNFQNVLSKHDDPKRTELPPMFSWLSSTIPEYPETLNLKMSVHLQELGQRPHFELEATDHPLSQEFQHGISPERIREIMVRRLGDSLGS